MIDVKFITEKYLRNITKDYKFVYNRRDESGNYYYLNVESSFDIETTSYMNGDHKSAFMYIWMFGIGYDNAVIYGRTWNDFLKLIQMLEKVLKLDDHHNLITFIHNFSFEFQFMKDIFYWKNVFAVDERKPVKALISNNIEFRDSYILSGMSLDKTGENLTSHSIKKQVGFLDYSKIRTSETELTDKELLYCEYDIKVLNAYINEQLMIYKEISRIPLTNTGRVRKLISDNCFYTNKSHKKSSASKYKKYHKLMNDLVINGESEYDMLQRAFQGGFTHASSLHVGKVLNNVSSYDFTSSYPTVMLSELYPSSKAYVLKPKTMKELNTLSRKMCLVFNVRFKNLQPKIDFENYLSESKCYNIKNKIVNNGRIVFAEQLETTITNVDFDIIKQAYIWDKISIGKCIGYYKGYLPKPIIESILDLYQKKTTLKNVKGKEVEYLTSKGMLNSVYGMSVTNIIQDLNTFNNEDGWFKENATIDEEITKYNKNKKRFLFYPWGIFVTAYARRNLWSGILNVKSDYVYSDTDSLKALNMEKHTNFIKKYNDVIIKKLNLMADHYNIDKRLFSPKTIKGVTKPIGVWDNEGTYDIFKTLGAKRYIFYKDKELHSTIAGLSKKNGINYMFEKAGTVDGVFRMFDDDLYIPANKTGKMTHTYIDYEQTFKVTDFQGHTSTITTPSGVYLENCEFTLSISKEYADFINHVAHNEIKIGETKLL